jgi:hypothetical protein
MNKRQLEVEKAKLREEKKLLKELKKIYEDAAKEVEQKIRISNGKIDLLLSVYDELDEKQKSLLQSQIYQKKFQENLKKQLDELIGNLNADSYDSITRYLTDSYYTGYIGTMYDIQGQGIPLITPINEKQVTRAMTLNTKLSVPLYTRMGIDVGVLKKQIAKHISRGIATSSSYAHIARNIDGASNIGFNKAMRIARTEGHRIQVLSANDAQHAAKAKGCEVVKQWDATLDGRTRPMHRLLDGKLAEIDEPFVVDDIEVMYPGGFGIASQDVNCRCALLQRARWALDADELKTLKERAEYYGLDKSDDFRDFREKYLMTANRLKGSKDDGNISIEIDGFAPCLIECKTGRVIKTTVKEMKRSELKGYNKSSGWYIDWSKVPRGKTIKAIFAEGNNEIQGLIAYEELSDHLTINIHWTVANPKSNGNFTKNKEYRGIGAHLFAIAAKASIECGYDGFVESKAANSRLLEHYVNEFGAIPLGGYRFCLDDIAAKELLEKCNWREE